VRMSGGRGRGDIVPPAEFLPQAERFGLITEIDRFMSAAGIMLAARGRRVQVNISARSIGDDALVDEIAAQLHESGADPAIVIFELTETVALECPEDAQRFSARMAALGCGLALDDSARASPRSPACATCRCSA
jgi:EAL domain-containing protein (putative c-di-GMP-specific phosphodiesterase class I)